MDEAGEAVLDIVEDLARMALQWKEAALALMRSQGRKWCATFAFRPPLSPEAREMCERAAGEVVTAMGITDPEIRRTLVTAYMAGANGQEGAR